MISGLTGLGQGPVGIGTAVPLTRIPPSMLVGKPSTPQARLPYDITIR